MQHACLPAWAILCFPPKRGRGLSSPHGTGLGDQAQWAFQWLSWGHNRCGFTYAPPPTSRSLMRLSESAERDSRLIHASSGTRGAGPLERVRDKSRRGKCQACQTRTGQQTACAGPRAMSLTRRWLDLHIIIARWGLMNSSIRWTTDKSSLPVRQIATCTMQSFSRYDLTKMNSWDMTLLLQKQTIIVKYLMSFWFFDVLFDITKQLLCNVSKVASERFLALYK